ncbi:prepilin peptidase [Ferrimonas sediminicola]|uniref:Prepilin leader peptidase/N-methyltransferase n=1 Tax=Ferrimonas sediminicola TaxID=2569538 RepID=A0A4U1BKD9_9GAMM|nr:A24 family peptidase [Ferrimonas sediminicola]TKB51284.1 prepilin peptidase [Ferrimonas sediminicola]
MDYWITLFQLQPWLFSSLVALLGLILGSFLNVVIHRLPIMMDRDWRVECQEYCEQPVTRSDLPTPFNLATPRSRCGHCLTPIPMKHNIPLLSYLLLRGRCHHCGATIGLRYPLVELLTAAVSVLLAWQFGPTPTFGALWLLSLGLIALAFIDADTMLLPDQITLPLLWLGLLFNLGDGLVPLEQAVLGAAFGYLSLWSVFQLFRLVTGKEGMGYGDFKLLALFGAWLGWKPLLLIILLSSLLGAGFGLIQLALGRLKRDNPMPFGPWIILAGWVALLWGDRIVHWYLTRVVGL